MVQTTFWPDTSVAKDPDETSPVPAHTARRMLDELVTRALAYRTSPELRELLEFARRFPHLAPFNAMLLHVQNPGIRYALRAPMWEREYRRSVKPGARPYVVLQTMGPVSFVFDVSDTVPAGPDSPRLPDLVLNQFPTRGQPPPGALVNLKVACMSLGIRVEELDYATGQAGCVERVPGLAHEFSLRLNSKHTDAQKLATLAHELGHVFCGHLGETKAGFWPDRREPGRAVREFEAEAVAYLVTDRMALDIGSAKYLSAYLSGDSRLPDYSLELVLKAAGRVEMMAAGRFRLRPSPAVTRSRSK